MSAPAVARDLRVAPSSEAGPASALRRAALLLHAMAEVDRVWLLGQLSDTERRAVTALLVELSRLGIPSDRRILDEALATREPTAPAVKPVESGPTARLREAEVPRLAAVLQGEPPLLVARLLALADWPWRRGLLAELGATARRRIEQALEEDREPPGEALRAGLVEVVARRLEATAASSCGPRVSGWLRWRRRGSR